MNLWHELTPGQNAPSIVDAIIEIPKRSRVKYEICKKTGLLKLDRILYPSAHYPTNYGFIPQTFCGDGDPLDILILSDDPFEPRCMVSAKVIGVINMIDQGDPDDKILAVAEKDITHAHINDISDLPPHSLKEIQNFFETYKLLENKKVEIKGIYNKQKALQVIEESIKLYDTTFRVKG